MENSPHRRAATVLSQAGIVGRYESGAAAGVETEQIGDNHAKRTRIESGNFGKPVVCLCANAFGMFCGI